MDKVQNLPALLSRVQIHLFFFYRYAHMVILIRTISKYTAVAQKVKTPTTVGYDIAVTAPYSYSNSHSTSSLTSWYVEGTRVPYIPLQPVHRASYASEGVVVQV